MDKIKAFLNRIGMDEKAPVSIDLDFLGRIQTACVTRIAYENLDILAGKPLKLDADALFEKIVVRGRGGYCFELNGLLSGMLAEMGFSVTERFARFLRGEREIPMRRHRVTVVSLPDGAYFTDVGVGQIAPRLPLKMEEHIVQTQNGETYRFERDSRHGWVLWELHGGVWREYLAVPEETAYPVDFLQPSFFCENHPDSVFNKQRMIAIKTETGRKTIDGSAYKVFEGETLKEIRENLTDKEIDEILKTEFFLNV
ncbi:MAG: arylamine N-acetyltransferase [Clostridia bacterium]|nr:arylamine N-acetyltransferase [Clostridia bacterium]